MLLADRVELWKAQVRMLLGSKIAVKSPRFQGTDLAATNTILACQNILQGMALQNQEGIIIQLM
jgi:hypothetical protein